MTTQIIDGTGALITRMTLDDVTSIAGTPATNVLTVQGTGGTGGLTIGGAVASGAAASGNPMLIAGRYTAGAQPSYLTGQAGYANIDGRGNLKVSPGLLLTTGADSYPNTGLGLAFRNADDTSSTAQIMAPLMFNGTSWDRMRGDTTGGQWFQGGQAVGVSVTTNPVTTGGIASAAAPTAVSDGQVTRTWLSRSGATVISGQNVNGNDGLSNTNFVSLQQANGTASSGVFVGNLMFNGTSWDRSRKPNLFSRLAASATGGSPTNVKTTAGDVSQVWGSTGASVVYVQLYNKASAPVVGTDTPVLTIQCAASAPFSIPIPNSGAYFSTGISYAFTTDFAGTTASVASAVTGFMLLAA